MQVREGLGTEDEVGPLREDTPVTGGALQELRRLKVERRPEKRPETTEVRGVGGQNPVWRDPRDREPTHGEPSTERPSGEARKTRHTRACSSRESRDPVLAVPA